MKNETTTGDHPARYTTKVAHAGHTFVVTGRWVQGRLTGHLEDWIIRLGAHEAGDILDPAIETKIIRQAETQIAKLRREPREDS